MSYNRKIIRTSSYIEIWEYETPIFSSDNTEIDENYTSLKEKNKRRTFDELTSDEQEERIKDITTQAIQAVKEIMSLIKETTT